MRWLLKGQLFCLFSATISFLVSFDYTTAKIGLYISLSVYLVLLFSEELIYYKQAKECERKEKILNNS